MKKTNEMLSQRIPRKRKELPGLQVQKCLLLAGNLDDEKEPSGAEVTEGTGF